MARLEALGREWKRNPPVALMIKAFLGIKDEPELPSRGVERKPPDFATLPDIEE